MTVLRRIIDIAQDIVLTIALSVVTIALIVLLALPSKNNRRTSR